MEPFPLPAGVAACRDALWAAGWPAYPVGGCVRDLLLGRPPGDYDMATAASPEVIMALFPHTRPTGLRHGTVTVLTADGPVEATTFRRDGAYRDGRRPEAVTFSATLEEDLGRRDFTINAMALDRAGRVIDPFDGQGDLEGRVIRCVGEPERRFSEDALRMFRAVRLSAQLCFGLPGETWRAVERCAPLAARLAAERVRAEVEKTLCSPRPGAVESLFRLGVMERYTNRREGKFSSLDRLPRVPLAQWAGLCAALDQDPAELLTALRLERRICSPCQRGFALWKSGLPHTAAGWRRALAQYGQQGAQAAAWMGDWAGEDSSAALEAVLASGDCWSVDRLALSGGDLAALGLRGAEVGKAQRFLLSCVLDRPQDNAVPRLLALLEREFPAGP